MMLRRLDHRAYTLIETLVVIGLLGILVGLMLSAVQKVRGAAATIACTNNMKQTALACQNYESAHRRLPASMSLPVTPPPTELGLPWTVQLLPFVDHEAVYGRTLAAYDTTYMTSLSPPHTEMTTVLKIYTCFADNRLTAPITDDLGYSAAYKSYVAVVGGTRADGAMRPYGPGVQLAEITDGVSNTLLVGERPPLGKYFGGVWYSALSTPIATQATLDAGAANTGMLAHKLSDSYGCLGPFHYGPGRLSNDCDYFHFWSLHPGGANFAFCDGSVRFLAYSADAVLPALATRAGGEAVEIP